MTLIEQMMTDQIQSSQDLDLLEAASRALEAEDSTLSAAVKNCFGAVRFIRKHQGKILLGTDSVIIKSHERGHPASLVVNNEEQALRSLHGNYVPELVASGIKNERMILITRRAPGINLHSKFLKTPEIPHLRQQLITAIASIHEQGWVHNDIRPHNLIWDSDTKGLVVVDFEYATVMDVRGIEATKKWLLKEQGQPGTVRYIESQLNELGGRWRSSFGVGDVRNDLAAADRIVEEMSNRVTYWFRHQYDMMLDRVKGRRSY